LIYEPLTSIRLFVRYKRFDVLKHTSTELDDCFADNIPLFRDALLRNPGLAQAIGYGKKVRSDVYAWVILEWADKSGFTRKEFQNVQLLLDFLDEHPPLAEALKYQRKKG